MLLKYRLRSETEVRQRLEKKRYSAAVISKVIDFLKEKKFLDDNIFARAWIDSRLKRPLGLRRIKLELKLKGVPAEIIASQTQSIKNSYSEEEAVLEIAKDKFKKLEGIELPTAKRRVYAYLLRRGFSPEAVIDAINQLCKQSYTI